MQYITCKYFNVYLLKNTIQKWEGTTHPPKFKMYVNMKSNMGNAEIAKVSICSLALYR